MGEYLGYLRDVKRHLHKSWNPGLDRQKLVLFSDPVKQGSFCPASRYWVHWVLPRVNHISDLNSWRWAPQQRQDGLVKKSSMGGGYVTDIPIPMCASSIYKSKSSLISSEMDTTRFDHLISDQWLLSPLRRLHHKYPRKTNSNTCQSYDQTMHSCRIILLAVFSLQQSTAYVDCRK